MAIRNDFTAGEVLAAADLNDTFASKVPYAYGTATPSTTVDGFVWYDENETPPAPKFWDGAAFQAISAPSGLVHIATESFSAVSSVSLNGVFTSAYENYRIVFTQIGGTGSLNCRMRALGSDNTTSDYEFVRVFTQISTAGGGTSRNGAATTWQWGGTSAIVGSYIGDVLRPQVAQKTQFHVNGAQEDYVEVSNGLFGANTQFDGFTLYPDAATMTGTLRVYGYQNS